MFSYREVPDAAADPVVPSGPTGRQRLAFAGTVLAIAGAALALTISLGRQDSAMLYVGLPCSVAFGLGNLPVRPGFGRVMQVIGVLTLLISAFLHEGAFCMVLASPVIVAAAFIGWTMTRRAGRRRHMLAGPVILLIAMEGVGPGGRIAPVDTVSAERVVPVRCDQAVARIAAGPRLSPGDVHWLLRPTPYSAPTGGHGASLDVGSQWSLLLPTGAIDTEVIAAGSNSRTFQVVSDTAKTRFTTRLRDGAIAWTPDALGCRVTVSVTYERRLDPSMWFGPVTAAFMDAGVQTFLASLTSGFSTEVS